MNDEKFKKVIRKSFNVASIGYDRPAMRFFDQSAERLVKCVSLEGHENVLDVATGTGKVALAAAARLKKGSVTGVDLSEGMLLVAKRKARYAGLTNASFLRSDVDALRLSRKNLDGLFCGFGVFFWSNMERSLSRLLETVKPDGFVAISSFAKGSFEPQSGLCLSRFHRYGVKLPKSYTWERLGSIKQHKILFQKVGLKNIRSHKKQMGYYLDGSESWWDLVRYTGFRSFLNKLSPSQAKRYKVEHMKEIKGTADKKGIWLNVEVIFTVACR